MRRAPGVSVAGYVPYANEIILSGTFQKKVITVNYDFPGYRYACITGDDPATRPLVKNHIWYRETTSPGKYAPLQLFPIHANSTTQWDVANNDANKFGVGAGNLIHVFDNSASVWASGTNDRNRYVSAVGAADSGGAGYARDTINGALSMTIEADVDVALAGADSGIVNFIDYVIVDQEIDFRTAAKPSAIAGDFAIDAIYTARVNAKMIANYGAFPSNFLATVKANVQRIIFDIPQL